MEKNIEIINNYIGKHNQFDNDSDLWKEIQTALGCTEKQAKHNATTHCNSFSFYCCLIANGFIIMNYVDFFSWGVKYKAIDDHGFISWEKQAILDAICNNVKVKDYSPDSFLTNGIYQVRLQNNHGSHFMFSYFDETKGLYISDTGNRGVGVPIITHLYPDDKIVKLKKFIQEK